MLLQLVMAAIATVVMSYCCVGMYILLVDSINCEMYHYCGASEIVGVHYQGTMILCAYCQSSVSNLTLIDSLTQFQSGNYNLPVIIILVISMSMNVIG